MTFFEAVKSVLRNYATFAGRARRAEYWFWTLFTVIISICTSIMDAVIFPEHLFQPLNTVFSIAILVPAFAVTARRLHDVNRSGWWQLLYLLPVIGWLALLYWFVQPGTSGDNRFGPDPLANDEPVPAVA